VNVINLEDEKSESNDFAVELDSMASMTSHEGRPGQREFVWGENGTTARYRRVRVRKA